MDEVTTKRRQQARRTSCLNRFASRGKTWRSELRKHSETSGVTFNSQVFNSMEIAANPTVTQPSFRATFG
jgi:hypothetical protein